MPKPIETEPGAQVLRILSYNVQVGIKTSRPHQYLTGSWRHLLPCAKRLGNLDLAAQMMKDFDIVGVQEVDAGSLRSNFINLTEYLAEQGRFPYWHHQVNRRFGRLAQHSNGLLSHFHPTEVTDLRLPGLIPGRQAILARYDSGGDTLAVIVVHLALSRRARFIQMSYLADIVNRFPHAIIMGDMNCRHDSKEMQYLISNTRLHEPIEGLHTFPSWRPQHNIDHILVTSELTVSEVRELEHFGSDHLPMMMEVCLPKGMEFHRYQRRKPVILNDYLRDHDG
ncbi:endonuclease/exonuclease/phosphatase family protein [Thiohalophilus thiocyanatoxydans]|uniref:Endonuclease/exonuclease/phosphatase family metal-dependent hydrolase n=1 Tax=Thiohalophilus thiocyanatoxydans TaxID=381308 RepID=A0A4R8J1G3_9GAMM|nr:endonuclease/exonuclease/phosphatase family protein [Thiohalophilus thiocyanatoxydans]TDY03663.1 endonuclease/exonuclease/phosphatase family metal-dependent hydrolase [Thiohalophilus thiocyanatoxydans]